MTQFSFPRFFTQLKRLFHSDPSDSAQSALSMRTITFASIFLSLISAVLTVMNIVNRYTFMTLTTGILFVGFLFAAFLSGKLKKKSAAEWVVAAISAFIFTVYAITGENEGFACLWILLMPMVGMSILSPLHGICVSLYFQLFLIVFFYTPLHNLSAYYSLITNGVYELPLGYTHTFMVRFPVLYFCDMGVSMLLSLQKQYFYLLARDQARNDSLTGLSNRNRYIEFIESQSSSVPDPDTTVISMDLNNLKITNDTHGHLAGDEMLIGVAECMHSAFPNADLLCRIGGDEFAVFTRQTAEETEAQVAHFRELAEAYSGMLVRGLTMSIGVCALRDHPGSTLPELAKIADESMYRNKAAYHSSSGHDRRAHPRSSNN